MKKFLIKHNVIKGDFVIESFIYIKNHKPVLDPTDIMKWLEPVKVHCYYKDKDREAYKLLYDKYPQYKGLIWLY